MTTKPKKNLVSTFTSFSPARPPRWAARVFLLLLITTLLSITATADSEQYLTAGVTRANDYAQDGSGVWTGNSPLTYTRLGTIQSYFPVVGDVDGDSNQEILIIDNAQLNIYNFTSGAGLVLEQQITHGNPTIDSAQYYVTPYIINTESYERSFQSNSQDTYFL